MRMFSLRILGSIRHGGRQEIGILDNKLLVQQRSARSLPPRRRRMSVVEGKSDRETFATAYTNPHTITGHQLAKIVPVCPIKTNIW